MRTQNLGNGKIQIIETQTILAGGCAGDSFEESTIAYETKEAATQFAARERERNSNLVCLGLTTVEINGKPCYYPTFNIWD